MKKPKAVYPLPLPLASASDLYNKLQRDATLLQEEVTTDRLFNFVVTGRSLIDWIGKDPKFNGISVQALYDNPWLKICGELANASKHFSLDKQTPPITKAAISEQGYGVGRYGAGGYGVGEEAITIELHDGTSLNCLIFIAEVMAAWGDLFGEQGS